MNRTGIINPLSVGCIHWRIWQEKLTWNQDENGSSDFWRINGVRRVGGWLKRACVWKMRIGEGVKQCQFPPLYSALSPLASRPQPHQYFCLAPNWKIHLDKCGETCPAKAPLMYCPGGITSRQHCDWDNCFTRQIEDLLSTSLSGCRGRTRIAHRGNISTLLDGTPARRGR